MSVIWGDSKYKNDRLSIDAVFDSLGIDEIMEDVFNWIDKENFY